MRIIVIAAALLGLLLVAAGAAGAHLAPIEAGPRWQGAILYGFVHTLAALAAALLPFRSRLRLAAGWGFILGVALFSGVQIMTIMLAGPDGAPGPLDGFAMLVPLGGVGFIAGWLMLGLAAANADGRGQDEDSREQS